jgi:nucleotide-binding universal stress UspA family protein
MFKHIVLATDGSSASRAALDTAVRLAREHAAVLTAVYVVDPYPYLGLGEANPMGLHAYLSAAREHAAAAHSQVLREVAVAAPGVDLRLALLEDVHAAEGIVAAARTAGADLLVVGSHGRRGVDRVLLGSVATRVLRQSPVPVLVVRGEPPARLLAA